MAPPRLAQLLLVAARILSYEWESISTSRAAPAYRGGPRPRAHDPVTGLPNRGALLGALEREWELARRGSVETFVVVAHLNERSLVERHGQAVADLILRDVAEVLTGAVRRADHLAQIADDALAIALVGCKGEEGARAFVARVARGLDPGRGGRACPGAAVIWSSRARGHRLGFGAVELAEVTARAAEPVTSDSIEELA